MANSQSERYCVARKLSQSPEQATEQAKLILTSNGFRLDQRTTEQLVFSGPGLRSTRQNPLLGAKKVWIRTAEGHLAIEAELSAMRRLQRFIYWFPWTLGISLGLVLGIVQGIAFGSQSGAGFGVPTAKGWMWMAFALIGGIIPATPWLILSPIMARAIEKRTKEAIDTLCVNSAD